MGKRGRIKVKEIYSDGLAVHDSRRKAGGGFIISIRTRSSRSEMNSTFSTFFRLSGDIVTADAISLSSYKLGRRVRRDRAKYGTVFSTSEACGDQYYI